MLTQTQLATMLALQNKMNEKVNPAWLTAGYGYLRAAMVETVEAIEHHGWKWWKAQQKDLAQLQMELVDIWHFALSASIIDYKGDTRRAAQVIADELNSDNSDIAFDNKNYNFTAQSLLHNLQLMAGLCAAGRFSVPLFMHIVEQCSMNSDELYRQYVGKNVLNFFRQDNGYKTGSYIKIWQGREDNEHLVEVLDSLDINAPDYSDKVYQALATRYPGT